MAGVSPTQASIERIPHVDLLGTAHVLLGALADGYEVKALARDRSYEAPALPTEAEVVEGDVTRAAVH
ncbi:hypothetical protein Slala03_72010 [Streptomyces lavendulae subsp. lavendulae]|uniref:hypothetical protein n=1 Tax=Streptomyces lavendulae TaxID=1914 RepID=UPI0024A5CE92|nr:hypothetical protein [Streptomyces lavendulae]GLV87512.1 hypothetical protein Slala03_72010 [Streptomyces lavendulae subsp. lavendulae]